MRIKLISALLIFVLGLFAGFFLTARFELPQEGIATTEESEAISKNPPVSSGLESPFVRVAEEVMPCVVNISAERVRKIEEEPFFEFKGPFEEFFKKFFESHPFRGEERAQVLGSGFIFKKKGNEYYIMTNNHVVKGATKIIIKLSDKSEYKGKSVKIVGTDPKTDVAVLKIKADHELPVVRLGDSDSIKVGDWAIAIGNPFGLERTVTVGVISAKGRSGLVLPESPTYQDFIQTDAAINFGNSGGPLVNIKGEVIGINTAIKTPSGGFVGIGFAIPINLAKYVAKQLIEKGKVIRGYLGINIQPITPELAEAYGLERPVGVVVTKVLSGTPAEKGGLKEGDVIIEFNGKPVEDLEKFRIMVAETPPGTKVEIVVVKEGGKRKTLEVTLGEYPEEIAEIPEEGVEEGATEWLGMRVVPANSDEARELGIDVKEGVVVVDVEHDSPAGDAGIERGDVIKKIGSIRVKKLSDFERAKKEYKDSEKPVIFHLTTYRGDRVINRIIAIRPKQE
jgi:serine protease Do